MSSISGGGVGGNTGGTMQPTARDIETSAWSQVNKQRMGIVPDTIEMSFTQVGGNLWKYSSDSARPLLMSPGALRTMGENLQKEDESWKQIFDELVDKLPPDIKETFLSEYAKRADQRSVNYSALTKTLTTLAKGLSWMEKAQNSPDIQSVEFERILKNRALPGKALKSVVSQGKNMQEGANAYLDKEGPNNVHHDALRYFTKQSEDLQGRMETLLAILSDPEEEVPTTEQMNHFCEDIGTLGQKFNQGGHGNHLQILSPMLESMETIAQALSITPSSPSLFIGLKTALKGIFTSESAAGIFGEDLEALMNALQNGLLGSLMKKMGPAKMKMLMMMLMSALGGTGVLGSILGERRAKNEEEENEDEEAERKFIFSLNLELLTSTELIRHIYKIIAEACGQGLSDQEQTADAMELASLLMLALTASEGKIDRTAPILQELQQHIGDKVDKTEKIVSQTLFSGKVHSSGTKSLNIVLQQARLALAAGNFEGLIYIIKTALEHFNASSEGLNKDLGKIKKFADQVKYAFGSGLEEENKVVTGMIRAA